MVLIQIFQKCRLLSGSFLKQITDIEHKMVEYKEIAPDFHHEISLWGLTKGRFGR